MKGECMRGIVAWLAGSIVGGWLGLAGAASSAAEAPDPRPTFTLETREAFDPRGIPAYAGAHPKIYAHIDANREAHLANLQRWLRQRSISAQNLGIAEMAELVRTDLLALGCQEAELVPTDGHPGVWAWCDLGAPVTLAVYMMYDVQPVEFSGWRSPPFEAQVVDHPLGKALMARGATNQKGPQRAFLNALESIRAVEGKLPVNLMFVVEGEEELGSPHYPQVIAKYADRLKQARGVLFPMNSQATDGSVTLSLGVKGLLYFELEAIGGARGGPAVAEIHGSWKSVVDAPAWRLAQALASLTSKDGNTILVPGYYDAIRAPTSEEQRLVNALLPEFERREPALRSQLGVSRWIEDWTGAQAQLQYLFNTTLNINGMYSGYTGDGVKTILPHRAVAKVDSRLVPNQRPEQQLELIRRHLVAQGFDDIVVRQLSGYPPSQTSVESPLVRNVIGVFNKYGHVPSVAPRLAGSAPYYVFTDTLGLPVVAAGLGHGAAQHAPNEYMIVEPAAGSRIAGLAEIEKYFVDLLYACAN